MAFNGKQVQYRINTPTLFPTNHFSLYRFTAMYTFPQVNRPNAAIINGVVVNKPASYDRK